jgi:hypothetical protein
MSPIQRLRPTTGTLKVIVRPLRRLDQTWIDGHLEGGLTVGQRSRPEIVADNSR